MMRCGLGFGGFGSSDDRLRIVLDIMLNIVS